MKPLLLSLVGMVTGAGCVTLPTGVHPWAKKTPQADNVQPTSRNQAAKTRKVVEEEVNEQTFYDTLRAVKTEVKADELE